MSKSGKDRSKAAKPETIKMDKNQLSAEVNQVLDKLNNPEHLELIQPNNSKTLITNMNKFIENWFHKFPQKNDPRVSVSNSEILENIKVIQEQMLTSEEFHEKLGAEKIEKESPSPIENNFAIWEEKLSDFKNDCLKKFATRDLVKETNLPKNEKFFQNKNFGVFTSLPISTYFMMMFSLHMELSDEVIERINNWWNKQKIIKGWTQKALHLPRWFLNIHDSLMVDILENFAKNTSELLIWKISSMANILRVLNMEEFEWAQNYMTLPENIKNETEFKILRRKLNCIMPYKIDPWSINYEDSELLRFKDSNINSLEQEIPFRPHPKSLGFNFYEKFDNDSDDSDEIEEGEITENNQAFIKLESNPDEPANKSRRIDYSDYEDPCSTQPVYDFINEQLKKCKNNKN